MKYSGIYCLSWTTIYSENRDTRTDSVPTPVFGPSIQFAGQAARWTGDSYSFKDQVGIEARVNFETFSGDRVTSYLTIINNGTTSVYYDWKVRPVQNWYGKQTYGTYCSM